MVVHCIAYLPSGIEVRGTNSAKDIVDICGRTERDELGTLFFSQSCDFLSSSLAHQSSLLFEVVPLPFSLFSLHLLDVSFSRPF